MLAVVAGVYVLEGFPMGLFADLLPVYWKQTGVPLGTIGALSGLGLAWAAKPLWSPLVQRFGEHRRWIAAGLGTVAFALLMGGQGTPSPALLWGSTALLCFASATQDIAIDAYTIGIVPRGEEGPANSVRITAYRVGVILAGTVPLLVAGPFGWRAAHAVAAGLAGAMVLAVGRAPRVEVPLETRRDLAGAFRTWRGRGGLGGVLGFVLLYRVGDLMMAPMLKPFWVDRGLSNEEIAFVSTTLGTLATVAGAAVGGWVVLRTGLSRSLLALGIAALGSNLGYAAAAAAQGALPVYAASLAEAFCGGLAAAGFLAFLMRICEPAYAAVQYAVLTGAYAMLGRAAGTSSGWIVEQVGYGAFFAGTALAALPGLLLLPAARRWVREVAREEQNRY